MKLIVQLLTVSCLLSGCGAEPQHDVAYYLSNPAERKHKIQECDDNPGAMAAEVNCINAKAAQRKALFKGGSMPTIK